MMEPKYSLGERVVCLAPVYDGSRFVDGYLTNAIIINIETKIEGEEQTYVVKNDDGVYWVRRESEIAPIELDPGELKIRSIVERLEEKAKLMMVEIALLRQRVGDRRDYMEVIKSVEEEYAVLP